MLLGIVFALLFIGVFFAAIANDLVGLIVLFLIMSCFLGFLGYSIGSNL